MSSFPICNGDNWPDLTVGSLHGSSEMMYGNATMKTEKRRSFFWVLAPMAGGAFAEIVSELGVNALVHICPESLHRLLKRILDPNTDLKENHYCKIGNIYVILFSLLSH